MAGNRKLQKGASRAFAKQAGRDAADAREEFLVERDFQQNLEYITGVAGSLASMSPKARVAEEENVDRLLALALATGNGALLAKFNATLQKIFDLEENHAGTHLHPWREDRVPGERAEERAEHSLRKLRHEAAPGL